MAVGIRYAILNLVLVLIAARITFAEVHTQELTHKVRRNTGDRSGNSNQWTKDDHIHKLRQEIIASLPADLPAYLLDAKIHESNDKDISPELSALTHQVEHFADVHGNDAIDNLGVQTYLSRHPSRNNYQEGLDKRNGFFYGKRNGFFFGKRDTEAVESDSCIRCGPNNSGQCVMYGTCCSPEHGCFFMTKESAACLTSRVSTCLSQERGPSCSRRGICVANGVCCSPRDGACKLDPTCRLNARKTSE